MMPIETPFAPPPKPFYRRRWFRWATGGVIAVLVVGGITVWALTALWRSSPELALLDAVQHAMKTPGVYQVKTDMLDATIVARDQRYGLSGTISGVPLEAVLYGGTLNVRSSQPDKLYDLLMANTQQQDTRLRALVLVVAQTIKDKWISINLQSTPLHTGQAQTAQCFTQGRDALANDVRAWNDIRSLYMTHRFVQASDTGNNTYAVKLDGQKATDFMGAFYQTDFYRSLTDCESTAADTSAAKVLSDLQVAFVLSPQRTFQSATAARQGKQIVTATARYTDVPAVDVPTDAISFDQLALRALQAFTSGR